MNTTAEGWDELDDDDAHERWISERAWVIETHGGGLVYDWEAHWRRLEWQAAAERGGEHDEGARRRLAQAPEVSALDALAASRELINLVTKQRWCVMQAAREDGASWDEIGKTLGTSGQEARRWYGQAIARRAEIDPDHDVGRAERAL